MLLFICSLRQLQIGKKNNTVKTFKLKSVEILKIEPLHICPFKETII